MEDKTGKKEDNNDLVLSYLYLRRIVGILGFAFPIILHVGSVLFGECKGFQDSISDYHNVCMRDVFVGLLSAISLFLFVYAGYDKLDSFMARSAGILGFMVCIFPDEIDNNPCAIDVCQDIPGWFWKVHIASAIVFFLILAYFSIFLFTKSKTDNDKLKPESRTILWLAWNSIKLFFQKEKPALTINEKRIRTQKEKRNIWYRWCGYIILLCLVILGIYFLVGKPEFKIFGIFPVVFFFEVIALWAFAVSWFIKGDTILKDKLK